LVPNNDQINTLFVELNMTLVIRATCVY